MTEFRFADASDCKLILYFIKELAQHVNMLDEVEATEALLEEWLFKKQKAEVLFIMVDGKEVGFALFYHNFSTFLGKAGIHLEDLYVKEECRGKGYGRALLRQLAYIATERNCGRLEWWCLDQDQSSTDFYLSLDAQPMNSWTVYRLADDTLLKLSQEAEEARLS